MGQLEKCHWHRAHYISPSNLNQEDGAESYIHSFSAKLRAEMLGRKLTCAVPGCKKENQGQYSLTKKDNIQKEWLN